jgi:tryptophan 2,3-dioxygenase
MGEESMPTKYYDYIQLEKLLTSQLPISKLGESEEPAHHELFFIIIHQVYELWFKAILFELDSVLKTFEEGEQTDLVDGKDVPRGIKEKEIGVIVLKLNRIIEILKLLIAQIRVMESLTPLDFLDFREVLKPASGYDSLQFHMLEVKFGLTLVNGRGENVFNPERVDENGQTKYGDNPVALLHIQQLKDAEGGKSLFQYVDGWLGRTPFVRGDSGAWFEAAFKSIISPEGEQSAKEIFDIDVYKKFIQAIGDELHFAERPGLSHQAFLAALFIHLYRDEPILQQPHRLIEALKEIDELFAVWRDWHSSMVMRMIGHKPGTAGGGYKYLAATTHYRFFPELDRVSTYMIPKKHVPPIPPDILNEMQEQLSK